MTTGAGNSNTTAQRLDLFYQIYCTYYISTVIFTVLFFNSENNQHLNNNNEY